LVVASAQIQTNPLKTENKFLKIENWKSRWE
jgi:hypothetical protein